MKLRHAIATALIGASISYPSSMASGQSPEDYGARTMQDKVCYSVRDDLVSIRGGDDDLRRNVHVRSAYGNPNNPSDPRIEKNNCRIVRGSAELCVPASIYLGNSPERRFRGESYEGFEPNVFPSELEFENGINPNNIYEDDELCYKVSCEDKRFPFPQGYDEVQVSDITGQRNVEPRRITKICTPARRSLYQDNQRFVKRASVGESIDEGGFPTGTVQDLKTNESNSACFFNIPEKFGCSDPDGDGPLQIGEGQLGYPVALEVDSRQNRYILDELNGGVYVFDSSNNFLRRFGEDILSRDSYGISIDSQDNVYVADSVNNRITKFSSNGNLLQHFEGFNGPYRLDIDSQDNIWVADTLNERIVKLDNLGNTLQTFSSHIEMEEGPKGIAVDESRNRFYVTREGKYLTAHNILTGEQIASFIPSSGQFDGAVSSIAVDLNGYVFAHDVDERSIFYVFDSNGREIKKWGGRGRESGQFDGYVGITFDREGNIITCDGGNAKIVNFYRGSSLDDLVR